MSRASLNAPHPRCAPSPRLVRAHPALRADAVLRPHAVLRADAVLRLGATAEPATLDPTATDAAAGTQALLYNVFETLVRIDAEGQLKPLLAQAWDVSEDRLTYTFKLSPNARFSDGTPVTAEAFVAFRAGDAARSPTSSRS